MKLRIRGNSIRLRLMQSEVNELIANGSVAETVSFPDGSSFGYELKSGEAFLANFEKGAVIISIPADIAKSWSVSDELGVDHFLDLGNGQKLRLLIEKDLQCLTDRPHEDESDAFPNPNKSC